MKNYRHYLLSKIADELVINPEKDFLAPLSSLHAIASDRLISHHEMKRKLKGTNQNLHTYLHDKLDQFDEEDFYETLSPLSIDDENELIDRLASFTDEDLLTISVNHLLNSVVDELAEEKRAQELKFNLSPQFKTLIRNLLEDYVSQLRSQKLSINHRKNIFNQIMKAANEWEEEETTSVDPWDTVAQYKKMEDGLLVTVQLDPTKDFEYLQDEVGGGLEFNIKYEIARFAGLDESDIVIVNHVDPSLPLSLDENNMLTFKLKTSTPEQLDQIDESTLKRAFEACFDQEAHVTRSKLANKLAHEHEYDPDSFDEEREMGDLEYALELFEKDYVLGASFEELKKLEKELLNQIKEIEYEQEASAAHEGDLDYFQPRIPKFLEKKLQMVRKAILKLKYG